jgi:hypothetical protein
MDWCSESQVILVADAVDLLWDIWVRKCYSQSVIEGLIGWIKMENPSSKTWRKIREDAKVLFKLYHVFLGQSNLCFYSLTIFCIQENGNLLGFKAGLYHIGFPLPKSVSWNENLYQLLKRKKILELGIFRASSPALNIFVIPNSMTNSKKSFRHSINYFY